MFGFSKAGPDGSFGVIVDVSSASVSIAIVLSNPLEEVPYVVWSHVERIAVTDEADITVLAKKVSAATVQTFMELSTAGISTLAAYDKHAKLSRCEVSISAPWTYTVSKTITHSDEIPFEVTEEIIRELITSAEAEALQKISTTELFKTLGLEIIAAKTADITLNGYRTTKPVGKSAVNLYIEQQLYISQKNILTAIEESHASIIPRTTLDIETFVARSESALREMPSTPESYVLVDVSGEAIEFALIVNATIIRAIHVPWGHNSLAREIVASTQTPYADALGMLRSPLTEQIKFLTATTQSDLTTAVHTLQKKLTDLYARTTAGAELPQAVFLHTDTGFEQCFRDILTDGSIFEKNTCPLHAVSTKLFPLDNSDETRIALSASVFHKNTKKK